MKGLSLAGLFAAALLASPAFAQPAGPNGAPPPMFPSNEKVDLAKQAHIDMAKGIVFYPDVAYQTIRGYRPLKLDLFLHNDKALRPAVIWLHGGGFFAGNPRDGGVFGDPKTPLNVIAEHGYVVASSSYRLSSEAKFPAAIEDVKSTIRWLRINAAALGIDPNKITVWGTSAGGHLAALSGTSCGDVSLQGTENQPGKVSDCPNAVIDWFGPVDFAQLDAQKLAGGQVHNAPDSPESLYLGCNLTSCTPELLKASNAVGRVKGGEPPFLIMYGDKDMAVAPKQNQELYDALKAKGGIATIEVVPGTGHGFSGATEAQKTHILSVALAFLDKTFKGADAKP